MVGRMRWELLVGMAGMLAAAAATPRSVPAGEGCGCERHTVQHVHRHVCCRSHHCSRCNCLPPSGPVVASAPVAMSFAAFPVAAAPMAMVAQAPAYAPQAAPLRSTCGSDSSLNQLEQAVMKAVVERALNGNGSAAAPQSSPTADLDQRLASIDERVEKLGKLTEEISKILAAQNARIGTLEKK